ncbi:MAG: MliC family protein [Proteobacteria bacterium]|nr:MliC family protein [Pseudomonadota bacterium]
MKATTPATGVALATLLALSAGTACAATDAGHARVVTYVCANHQRIVVGYPEDPSARRATVRLSWQGRTVLLQRSGSFASGERYINAMAALEWWSSPNRSELRSTHNKRPLLSDCHPES